MQSSFGSLVKPFLKRHFFPEGTVSKIRLGPLSGSRILISEDMGWEVLGGRWEPYLQKVYIKTIKSGTVCYDLGANTGIHTLLFSKLVGKVGKVIAFEPHPRNCVHLHNLLELNNVSNVEVVEAAVSDTNSEVVFFEGKHKKQGSLVGIGCETGDIIRVNARTIDNLVAEGLPAPDFLKIDIEGAESRALEGARQTLSSHRPTMVIELHTPAEDIEVGKILLDLGYVAYRVFRNEDDRRRHRGSSSRIDHLDRGWPHPDGLWGAVVAVPADRLPAHLSG